MVNNKPH